MKYNIREFRGHSPKIDPEAFIAEGVSLIGGVHIGAQTSIWFNSVLRGDVNPIYIGKGTNIQDSSVIHTSILNGPTHIGDNVTVGHLVMIHACEIQNYAFIGMQATIMDKVVVEEFGMIAAGALVPPGKIIRSRELWSGVPAKFMRNLSDADIEVIKLSSENYIKISREYMQN